MKQLFTIMILLVALMILNTCAIIPEPPKDTTAQVSPTATQSPEPAKDTTAQASPTAAQSPVTLQQNGGGDVDTPPSPSQSPLNQEKDGKSLEPFKIIRKAGGALQNSATHRVEPSYPPQAKAARVSGVVVVEVVVDEAGNVTSARQISGHPLLRDAATAAARGWKFPPTILNGVPVKVVGTIAFKFNP